MKRVMMLAALLGCLATSMAFADVYNKKTKVTFSAPFQIPGPHSAAGVVTLPPGSYIFRLLDSSSNRHIVEVTNLRENQVHSTILAVADYRVNASSKTVMYFTERQSGSPMALKSWFYPGDNYGHRFVYPKVKAQQIAVATNEPVPSYSGPIIIEKTKYVEVPVYIETPAKQEVAYDAKAFEKTDATDSAGADGEAVKAPTPAAAPEPAPLPKTASPVPAIGLMGLLLVGASLLVRRITSELR